MHRVKSTKDGEMDWTGSPMRSYILCEGVWVFFLRNRETWRLWKRSSSAQICLRWCNCWNRKKAVLMWNMGHSYNAITNV